MAAILLDVDGVLHVSGEPIPGAADAVGGCAPPATGFASSRTGRRARRRSSRPSCRRWGSSSTPTRCRRRPTSRSPRCAASASSPSSCRAHPRPRGARDRRRGSRRGADRRRRRWRGDGLVFSYMNLDACIPGARAGAELYCLHRNRWWQTARGPLLDAGRSSPVSSTRRRPRRPCSGSRARPTSTAALKALDAEPGMTWMVGDDLESDIVGARGSGDASGSRPHREVPPGRPSTRRLCSPTGSSPRSRISPTGSRRTCEPRHRRHRPDRDRADPPLARAARRRLPRALLHRGRARVLRLQAEPGAALRGPFRRQGGGREGARLRRGHFTWREIEIVGRPKPACG